ncbi:hypothetical protein Vadar_021583 [Vaccinium darrowii]|uniref:Uncharacterized protein n=1 Tax=Vaccinium darrowii TaxID=229202 RepID=A0ACB7XS22_9ERIC|nr:hypothetical protein Vadar_021583 [Vaccinium darrowii]
MATGKRKFLLIGTDYLTKWIEGEALAKITEAMVEKFVWNKIITRFGVPYSIISANGSQFGKKFKAFCAQYGTTIQSQFIHRVMGKQRLQTRPSLRVLRRGWKVRRESGWTSYQPYFGHIELKWVKPDYPSEGNSTCHSSLTTRG